MVGNNFAEPHHIVPPAEFAAAVFKLSDKFKAEFFMEIDAAEIEIFVLFFRHGDAGIHIYNALRFQRLSESSIQSPPAPFPPKPFFTYTVVSTDQSYAERSLNLPA